MPVDYPQTCLDDLRTVLAQLQPQRILFVTSDPDDLKARMGDILQREETEVLSPEAIVTRLDRMPVYDVAVLLNAVERLERHAAESLIAALRDMYAHHLFVLLPIGSQSSGQASYWRQSDMLALGLSVYRTYQQETGVLQWYRFELESYKATPEWLNSKYWANPELFGKYRW